MGRRGVAGELEGAGVAGRAGPVPVATDGERDVRAAGDDGVREGRHVREPRRAGPDVPGAARPPAEARSELQLAYDLLGRKGLVQPTAVRTELATAVPTFADLAERRAEAGKKLELTTV